MKNSCQLNLKISPGAKHNDLGVLEDGTLKVRV